MGGNAKPDKSHHRLMVCAFLLAAFTLFAGLGRPALMEPDEERNAEVAREMKESGAWLVPTYNGLPYLDKPAFYFKTVALSFDVLGETAMAARLPSALSAFALLVMLFGFCHRVYSNRCASLAVMVVATCPLYVAFARLVIMDMMLAFFVCAAIFAGFLGEEDEAHRKRWYLLGAVASGFATLIKGPVGFLLPVLVLSVFYFFDGRRAAVRRLFTPLNLIVFFLIVLPWFLGVTHSHPDFAYYGIIEESWHRYTTTSFRRTGPFYYYVPWIFLGAFAWSLLLPESVVVAWKSRKRWSRADLLFVVWSVVLLVFFSVSRSKRPDYILTVVVALGALIARIFEVALLERQGLARRLLVRGAGLVVIVAGAGAAMFMLASVHPAWLGRLSHGGEGFQWLLPVCVPVACGLAVVTIIAGLACWRKSPTVAFCAFLLVPVVVFSIGFRGFLSYANTKTNQPLAQRIGHLADGAEIVCLRCFPSGLPLYLKRCVVVVTDTGKEFKSNYIAFMLRKTTQWPAGVIRSSERDDWLAKQQRPLYVIAPEREHDTLVAAAAQKHASVTELEPGLWGALLPR